MRCGTRPHVLRSLSYLRVLKTRAMVAAGLQPGSSVLERRAASRTFSQRACSGNHSQSSVNSFRYSRQLLRQAVVQRQACMPSSRAEQVAIDCVGWAVLYRQAISVPNLLMR